MVAAFTEDEHVACGRNADLDVAFPELEVARTGLGCRTITAGYKDEEPEVEDAGVLCTALVVVFTIDDEVAIGVSTNATMPCALDAELRSTGIFSPGTGSTVEIEETAGKLLKFDAITDNTAELLEDEALGKYLPCNLVVAESAPLEIIFGTGRAITRCLKVDVELDACFGVTLRTDLAVTDPDDKDASEVIVTIPA